VILSYGVPLGEVYKITDQGKVTSRKPIKEFALDKWFFAEEHFRPANDGFVFFVHTKFLLIDPLSDDPLVCSGSANFSSNSLLQNDENMLFIRGNTRVADIYMTEFDRIFRHFYFRDIANELAAAKTSDDAKAAFLDETDGWTTSYFRPGTLKSNRRIMFFEQSAAGWADNAAAVKSSQKTDKPVKKAAKKAAAKKANAKKTTKVGKAKARKKTAPKKTAKTAARKTTGRKTAKKTGKKKATKRKATRR
jgi:phosphatidylserine/phosphatidylglycerophosphate/cardiolipin synthase-like enzyme